MRAAAIMADLTPPDKKVMAAREGLLAARKGGVRLLVRTTASRAEWGRHENPLAQPCVRGAHSVAVLSALVLPSEERRAHVPPLLQGDSVKDH